MISCNGHAEDTVVAHMPSHFLHLVKIRIGYAGMLTIFALKQDDRYCCVKHIFTIAFVAFITV